MPATAVAVLIPDPPRVDATSYLLMDATSGQVLVEHNADNRLPPASLTKMMTAYITEYEIKQGNISLKDRVPVSVKAWRMGGSKMFIREGTEVVLEDLLRGVIVQSGNDASVALAEYIAGSEDSFADLMNQHARRLGLSSSSFVNATGWPAENHYVTARDMAILARAIIVDFPELYKLYSEKSFEYNNITQQNRNLLLWRDDRVDGLKTGHTEEAGYCLVASGVDEDMRLVTVVMGTDSEQARARESQKLLTYGFRFYETYRAYDSGDKLADVKVWLGETDALRLGPADDLVLTIPRGSHEQLQAEMSVKPDIRAPIQEGESFGTVTISLDGKVLLEKPLVALESVAEGGFLSRLWDHIVLFFRGLF
ncbi:MAG: D-alanyl-D-alanine carboxypeptidase [Alcanivoracaceae bacterium]|nr:D-alanyl-D-alanine carboxypeptidase [Alcanivoracaceae bacterium]